MKKAIILIASLSSIQAAQFNSETGIGTALENPSNVSSVQTYHKTVVSEGANEARFRTDNRFNTADGRISSGQGELEVGYDRTINKDFKLFGISDLSYNLVNSVNNLYLLGGGVKYYWINTESIHADSSLAVVYNRLMQADSVIESASLSLRNRVFYDYFSNRFLLSYSYVAPVNFNANQIHTASANYIYTYAPQVKFKIGYQYSYILNTKDYLNAFYAVVIFSM